MEYYKNITLELLTGYDPEGNFHVERFEDIPEYEGYYQASTFGRVRSFVKHKILYRMLRPQTDGRGYLHVTLCKNGLNKVRNVHRLVAMTFILNPENKPQVNHKDLDKTNNCLWNLEWNTERENQTHRYLAANTSSKYTGVSWSVRDKVWIAIIAIKKKHYHLGSYKIEEDAHKAYQKALKELKETGKIIPYVNRKWTSLYRGVNFDQRRGRWEMSIMRNGKRYRKSGFASEEEAIEAHKKKTKELDTL